MTEQPTRDHLLHLVGRARRGVALPEELDQLATGITAMTDSLEHAEGAVFRMRDRAEVATVHAEQAEADRDRVQLAACRTAEKLRHAEDRIVKAEAAAERVRASRRRWVDHAFRLNERTLVAEAAIGRARKLATQWAVLRAYGSATTELRNALDEPQLPLVPPVHLAKGANAEDCPACKGTNPPYPFLCPGPEQQSSAEPDEPWRTCCAPGSLTEGSCHTRGCAQSTTA